MPYSGINIDVDAKLQQYIFEQEPKKITKKYNPAV